MKDQLHVPRKERATINYRSKVLIVFEKLICRTSCPSNRNNIYDILAPA